jgi:hypothetical protein
MAGHAGTAPLFAYRPARCPCEHQLGPRVKTGWMPCLCAPAREAAGRGPGPRASPAALPGAPPGAPRHDALRAASPNQAPAGCSVKRAYDRPADPSLTRKESATGRHAGPVIRSRSATGASQRQCASIRRSVSPPGEHQTVIRRRLSRRAAGRGRGDGAGEGQRHQSGCEKAEPADCEEAGRLGVAGELGEHRAAHHQGDACAAQDRRRKSGAD